MADLIDRAALLDEIQHDIENSGCVNHEREIIDCVRYAPTVDAEPVVRCRDCENATMTMNDELKYCKFWQPEGGESLYLPGGGFCSEGKRMDADAPERGERSGT